MLCPCPRFSGLFVFCGANLSKMARYSALTLLILNKRTSPESMKPVRIYPHHQTLLSSFDSRNPNSDTMPSVVPAKRSADTLSEGQSENLTVDDSSHWQANTESPSGSANLPTIPSHSPIIHTTPAVPQATALNLARQPPACEVQSTMDDKPVWLGNLIWSCGDSEVNARVQATDPIRDSCVHFFVGLFKLVGDLYNVFRRTSKWPATLRVEIVEAGMGSLDMQARIRKLKAPVARFQCPPGIDNQHFGGLIKTLRKDKCVSRRDCCERSYLMYWQVAVVRLEVEIQDKGCPKSCLVLAPLNEGLLCATFPASYLPKASLQKPRQETQLQADYGHLADNSYANVEDDWAMTLQSIM
jgi:hypothetical protein